MMTMSLRKRVPKSIAFFDALWARVSRPDIAFATNRLARSLACPSKSDIIASKRLLRYLRGTQDLGLNLQVQNRASSTLTVFTDSDWAGDRPTRKSVSSWVIMLDGFLISAGARTQSVIAQSSCEAEYIAATAATSEAKYSLWTTREHPSAFRQLWRHWCGKQKRSATVASSGRAISVVAGGDRQQEHSNQQGAWS